jgi:uncharacterized protein (DUF1499 family)
MRRWKLIILFVVIAVLGGVVFLTVLSGLSRRPSNLGVVDERLASCPDKPNCVCTQATDERHAIPPLRYTGSAAEALANLKAVLAARPRTTLVTATDTYLHGECRSRLFRFVDDVEFLIDDAEKVIHFRSASRAGHSDLGVNRQRMEGIRKAFEEYYPVRETPAEKR